MESPSRFSSCEISEELTSGPDMMPAQWNMSSDSKIARTPSGGLVLMSFHSFWILRSAIGAKTKNEGPEPVQSQKIESDVFFTANLISTTKGCTVRKWKESSVVWPAASLISQSWREASREISSGLRRKQFFAPSRRREKYIELLRSLVSVLPLNLSSPLDNILIPTNNSHG